MVPPHRFELWTSPLPRVRSTPELRRHILARRTMPLQNPTGNMLSCLRFIRKKKGGVPNAKKFNFKGKTNGLSIKGKNGPSGRFSEREPSKAQITGACAPEI